MTTLREAAQQALEALEYRTLDVGKFNRINAACQALRAALAEPVQEPVAWIQPDHLQKARQAPFLCRVEPTKRMVDFVALYTAPPQRPPLTEAEIWEIGNATLGQEGGWNVTFCRAIERAHGIGGAE